MKDEFAEINVVPLVDIMLVLLVIVLVTANFMVQGVLPIKPPASNAESRPLEDAIVLSITADEEIYLGKRLLEEGELEAVLSEYETTRPVLISADKDLTLQPFVTLVDSIKGLGFTSISIQTQR